LEANAADEKVTGFVSTSFISLTREHKTVSIHLANAYIKLNINILQPK
jgi:hypothetical protein